MLGNRKSQLELRTQKPCGVKTEVQVAVPAERNPRAVRVTVAAQMALEAPRTPESEAGGRPGPPPPEGRGLGGHPTVPGLAEMPRHGLVVLLGPQAQVRKDYCSIGILFE